MSVILNPPVHFYKPVEGSKFVYEAPIVRSIFLEKDAVEIGEMFAFWRCPSQKRQGNDRPYVSIPGSSRSFKVVR